MQAHQVNNRLHHYNHCLAPNHTATERCFISFPYHAKEDDRTQRPLSITMTKAITIKAMKYIYPLIFTLLFSLKLQAQDLYFPPTTGNTWDTISPLSLGYCPDRIDSLYDFLDQNNTKAFILLRDGKIVLEKYFDTHTQNTPWQWASAGKTITAFMMGIAQQEGFLSILDPTSKYLGQGWTSCTTVQEEKITVRNQLTMTSGLDDKVDDPFCTLDTCLKYKADAGTRWAYHNGPYTLLDEVISDATGQTLNAYTNQKLKIPTGMTGSFVSVGFNNVYFSNARSMARFGLLILNKGNWNGKQIMTDDAYFNDMTNTSQTLNNSYGYLWWLNGKASYMIPSSQIVFPGNFSPNAPADMIAALGKGGQSLNIIPSQKMVWLRMGEDPQNVPVPFLLNDAIWQYVNQLRCVTTTSNDTSFDVPAVEMFPNPSHHSINLKADHEMTRVVIFNSQGKTVLTERSVSMEMSLPIHELPAGLYLIHVSLSNGKMWSGKLLKE